MWFKEEIQAVLHQKQVTTSSSRSQGSAAGASLEHVVRTRTLLTDITHWEAVAAVRGEFFASIRPVDTVMEVSRFIDPEWLVEFEVDAVIDDGAAR